MKIMVCDRSSYRITRREYTDEGFLRVPGKVARTGIQDYLASELGLPGDPNRIVKVYRPPEEVFNADSLASYNGADITLNHPKGLVTADNYKVTSVGVVRGDGKQADDFVQSDLIVKDATAIKAINSGKCELSAGYTAVYDATPGITPEGEAYDYVQREIRINHVAIVDRARAGANARVFDNDPTGGNIMPVLITTDSGRSVDVADPNNAQVVADAFDRMAKALALATADAEKHKAFADAAKEELADAVQKTSDEAIKARVAVLTKTHTAARRVAGEKFSCDSADPVEVMRSAMAVARPKIDWGDKSPVYVQACFDMASEEDEDMSEEEKKKPSNDSGTVVAQLQRLSKDGALPQQQQQQTQDADKPVVSRAQASLNARTGKVKP